MKLTPNLVKGGISKVITKKTKELTTEDLSKVTHLHLQRKNISELDYCFEPYKNLSVLYLYDNEITSLEGLETCYNIEILHLEKNRIKSIFPLKFFTKLKKLFLGWNEIDLVEHLGLMPHLVELHIENQNVKEFIFDPLIIEELSKSVKLLNISGNQMVSLEDVSNMKVLDTLIAKNNQISNLDTSCLIVGTIANLRILDLTGNPITKEPKYREKIIGYGEYLEVLDRKDVSANTREFMKRFQAVKTSRLQRSVEYYKDSYGNLRQNYASCPQIPLRQSPEIDLPLKSFSTPIISMSPTEFMSRGFPGTNIGFTQVLMGDKHLLHPDQLRLPDFELAPKKGSMKIRKGSTRAIKKGTEVQLGIYKDPSEERLLQPSSFQRSNVELSFILPPRDRGESSGNLERKVSFVPSTCMVPDGNGGETEGDLGGMKYKLISPITYVESNPSLTVPDSFTELADLREDFLSKVEDEEEIEMMIPFKTSVYEFPPWPHIEKGKPPKNISDIIIPKGDGEGDIPMAVKYMP